MTDELGQLAQDFIQISDTITERIEPTFERTALEIKNRMQEDFKASTHFDQVGRTIDYETETSGDTLTAEIGPNLHKGGSAALQGIAYEGGIHGGGGTIPDPGQHADDQADQMVKWLQAEAGDIW